MQHQSNYIAKQPDKNGFVDYTETENNVWKTLFVRQSQIVQHRACDEFIKGISLLGLTSDRIPQCPDVSSVLKGITGWSLQPVPALITFDYFFELLANRQFPAATFIRKPEELDYIKEPDIFHELFGHCPLLTHHAYAEFMHEYGKLGMKATSDERIILARLFWFTIEFGLVKTPAGLRAYGGGILSSKSETVYCVESEIPERRPFDVMQALQTDYRIDQIQPIYYVLNSLDDLYQLTQLDLIGLVRKSQHNLDNKPKHAC